MVEGEVKFPGEYRIRKGETLFDVIARAGGFTDEASPESAIFTREAVAALEAKNGLLSLRVTLRRHLRHAC